MNRYIFPLVLVALSFGIYVMYIEKTYADIQGQVKQKQELDEYLRQAANAQEELAKLAAAVAGFPKEAEENLEKMVPNTIDHIRLIVDVNALANQFGFKVKSPQVTRDSGTDKSVAKYDRYILRFGVSAPYPIFREFLRALESSLALRDMSSIAFSATQAASGTTAANRNPEFTIYNYQIEIISYALQQ